ncbi:hypothetical protein JX265_001808 [Neoarthrinium moseri]|uniref:Pectate lyase n=1 Tax=Neoarthrinium moseri TaxID=1658444 RepID=A0A9Q0AU65_9PEZI|nr:hypothetical protein JX265_001808 [Neoarthrinium moseri]
MQYRMVLGVAASLALGANAAPNPKITPAPAAAKKLALRDSVPASSGSSALSAPKTIAAGEAFDGGMFVYDRGVSCEGQSEGGDSDAVFQIENGGTLSNVIIGPNQMEGVHCQGACTLENVWWSAVCEDAFTIKSQEAGETTYIKGGGAFGADDKVLQHNGGGTLSVSDFTVETFGKLYRSCGNCKTMYERHVIMSGITATSGKQLAGINTNYGDTATFTNIAVSGVDDICVKYTGTDDNSQEPTENGSGADGTYCIYSESDISGDTSGSGSGSGSSAAASSSAKKTTSSGAAKSTSAKSSDDEEATSTSSSKKTSTAKSSSAKATATSSSTKKSSSSSTKTSSSSKATKDSDSDAKVEDRAFAGWFRW